MTQCNMAILRVSHEALQLYYSCLFLAVVGAGLIWAGTNPAYTECELIHHLKTSKAKTVIVEPDLVERISEAAKPCNIEERLILELDARLIPWSSHPRSWASLLGHSEQDWVRMTDLDECKSTIACRLYGSGTTGLPKAASISHYNLVAEHTLAHKCNPKPFEASFALHAR